jgi:CRISPR/Cas system CSM-associated protein Csm3 (group 7 of RAMP superfamily)
MHGTFYNEALFKISLNPDTPILIKAGGEGASGLDPTLPDMSFVRTTRSGREPEVYLPGSSLRGVIRGYAEKLLRSIDSRLACNPTQIGGDGGKSLKPACFSGKDPTKLSGVEVYNKSCYACRLFGNTGLAGRTRFGDLYLQSEAVLETRYGVAIDRITGAVAQGPFEFETLTRGMFTGSLTVRNFTIGQLGLLAAAFLDMSDGLVPIGFGKSKGLGRVKVNFESLVIRTIANPAGQLLGAGSLRRHNDGYELPSAEKDRLEWNIAAQQNRGFFESTLTTDESIRSLLDEVARYWPQEVQS